MRSYLPKPFQYLPILSLLLLLACQPENSRHDKVKTTIKTGSSLQGEKYYSRTQADTLKFMYEDEHLYKKLITLPLTDNRIWFHVTVKSKTENCTFIDSGYAMCSCSGDPEIDEDEAGMGYPADEYYPEKTRSIYSIRIGTGKAKYTLATTSPCATLDTSVVLAQLPQ